MARANITLPTIGLPIITEDAKVLAALEALELSVNNFETEQLTDRATEFRVFEAPETWQTVSLVSQFGVGATLKYYRDVMGVVRFRPDTYTLTGAVSQATGTLATLPVGYRPDAKARGVISQFGGSEAFSLIVIINTNGTIVMSPGNSLSNAWSGTTFNVQFRGA